MKRRRLLGIVAAAAAAIIVIGAGVAWYALRSEPLEGPALAVQRALELREERSTDASAYAELFVEPEVASALASDAATAERSPVPKWERPYVSAQASGTADVVVAWRPSGEYEGWPRAHVFKLERVEDDWRIADASTVPSGTPLPAPAKP